MRSQQIGIRSEVSLLYLLPLKHMKGLRKDVCSAFLHMLLFLAPLVSDSVQGPHQSFEISVKHSSPPLKAFLPPWFALRSTLWSSSKLIYDSGVAVGMFYGQRTEDQHALQNYFHNMHNGIYLEMGAFDGQKFSNTKIFDDSLKWRGLLIEANPEEFGRILANRPNALSVNAAVCEEDRPLHFVSKGATSGVWVSEKSFFTPSNHTACSYAGWL